MIQINNIQGWIIYVTIVFLIVVLYNSIKCACEYFKYKNKSTIIYHILISLVCVTLIFDIINEPIIITLGQL